MTARRRTSKGPGQVARAAAPAPLTFDSWFARTVGPCPSDKSRAELVADQDAAHRRLGKAKGVLARFDEWHMQRAVALAAWSFRP